MNDEAIKILKELIQEFDDEVFYDNEDQTVRYGLRHAYNEALEFLERIGELP